MFPHSAEYQSPVDISRLHTSEPPTDRQFIAWGVEKTVDNTPTAQPRWWLVGWGADSETGAAYWRSSTQGQSVSIEIIGWLDLPWDDFEAWRGRQFAFTKASA
jgi:hypothetical protein